jgi:hypothetical protein
MDHSLAQAREGGFLEVVAFGRAGAAPSGIFTWP